MTQFDNRLSQDAVLAAACNEFAADIRSSAQEDAEAVARSERLTREDLEITVYHLEE